MDTFSVDVNPKLKGINLVKDIEHLRLDDIPWEPNIIWASLPCTTYSLAGVGHHRNEDGSPKTEFAEKSDRLAVRMVEILLAFPDALWYVENPRALLRTKDFMRPLGEPVTIWWCRYGDKSAKPTDIWTNNLRTMFNQHGWQPRSECWNGNPKCHHDRARRGSKTGTQGKKNAYERGKIPEALCVDVIASSLNTLAERHFANHSRPCTTDEHSVQWGVLQPQGQDEIGPNGGGADGAEDGRCADVRV